MKTFIKTMSLIMSVIMFLGVFSAANPAIAAEIQETEKSEEMLTTDNSENTDDTETEIEVLNEITDLRDEYTKHFRQSDGSYIAAKYSSPVHYQKNGKWVEYDFTIEENNSGKIFSTDSVFEPVSSDVPIKFPTKISKDGNNEIKIDIADTTISFVPKISQNGLKNASGDIADETELVSKKITDDASSTYSLKSDNTEKSEYENKLGVDKRKGAVKYENVFEDVNLEYEISSNVIKESIVLEKKQDKNVFEFTMDLGDLYPKKEQDGSIVLYTDSGYANAQSVIAPPYMVDSSGVYSDAVSMDLIPDGDKYTLTITADKNWLNNKQRAYPVVIDPTILLDINRQNTIDCYVDTSSPNISYPYDYYLYAGHSTLGKTRTFVKFNLPELPDECCVIQNVALNIYRKSVDAGSEKRFISVHTVTENWNNTTLSPTWNDQPEFATTALDYAELTYGCGDLYRFDITRAAKSWFENGNNYGVVLKGLDESKVGRAQIISAEYDITEVVYPTITVAYRNNIGLESYWSYSSYGVNTAGVAHINDYTGNLVYSLPILSSSGELMPLTLSAVFNNYCANEKLTVGKNNSSRTTPGKGFRLNIQETVLPSDKYGLSGDNEENYPYVYTDGDGTEHYFKKVTEKDDDGKETTVYKDEDGLGLTLEVGNECAYKIKDKSDTERWFNSQGNLLKILDANGNEIHIYFKAADTSIGLEEKSRISYITDGAGHKFTFSYYPVDGVESDYIQTITDNAGRAIKFTTTGGFLRSVKYYDETVTKIVYEGEQEATDEYEESAEGLINYVLSNDGYGINFDYTSKATGRRVEKVKEFGTKANGNFTAGQVVTFDRTEYNTTVIRSAGIDGIHYDTNSANGNDDIITTLQFDNSGRTVSQQVKYGSGSFVGAGSYEFTSSAGDTTTLGNKNRVNTTGSLGKNVVNLLTGGNAESATGWTHSGSAPSVATEKYMGTKSLKLTNTGLTGSGTVYYRQRVDGLTNGGTYTLSAYVKVGSVTKTADNNYTGAHLQITSVGTDDVTDDPVRSEAISETTDTEIDNGWRRITATVTIPDDESHTYVYLCLRNMNGTAYFDCIQLESGNAANSYNLLENSSFEKSANGLPTGWSAINTSYSTSSTGTVTNGITTAGKANGSQSVRITGEADVAKGFSQVIYVDGNPAETYIVSGWGKGYPVNSTYHTDGIDDKGTDDEGDDEPKSFALFEIAVKVTYDRTDANKNVTEVSQYKDSACFNTTITSWQYASTPFSLEYSNPDEGCTYTPKYFKIAPRYNKQVNYVYFDHLMLVKEPSQTYTYDDKGNLIKASANSEQKANAEYDDNDNMTSYTDTLGNTTKMNYDSKHNMINSSSPRGVKTENTYNSKGLVTSSEIHNKSLYINSGKENYVAPTMSLKTTCAFHDEVSSTIVKESSFVRAEYDENGYGTYYTYDYDTGVTETVKNAKGITTTYGYDSKDVNLTSVTSGYSSVSYQYDGNQLSKIVFGSGGYDEEYSFGYDAYGNKTHTYIGDEDNLQPLVTNEYGANNGTLNLTTYGNGDRIKYEYNNLGQKNRVFYNGSENAAYYWRYDASGTPVLHQDNQNDRRYYYGYDSLGRLCRMEIRADNTDVFLGYVEQGYDLHDNVNKLVTNLGGRTNTQQYFYVENDKNSNSASYSKDGLASTYVFTDSRYATYEYDSLNRITQRSFSTGTPLYNNYTYKYSANRNTDGGTLYRTTQLSTEFIANASYTYYYDELGNITSVKKGERTSTDPTSADFKTVTGAGAYRSYTYDNLSQLTRENNKTDDRTSVWTYDRLGNIQTRTDYSYTESSLGTETKYIDYQYGDDDNTSFNKLLKNIDVYSSTSANKSTRYVITYDAIGNPTKYEKISYDTDGTTPLNTTTAANLSWRGRQLMSLTDNVNSNTISYLYGADGLRKSKTVNGVKTQYYYVGDSLAYQVCEDGTELYFFYDSRGALSVIRYLKGDKDYHFYVATNMQGDVVGIYTADGVLKVSYEYDAWGNCKISSDTSGIDLGNVNPIRYRGYYYDSETGFYYLQSRYYCPKIGRFLNADVQLNGQEGLTGYNLFQYCGSNPIIRSDKSGTKYTSSYERTTNESANSLLGIFVTLVITWAVCNLFSTTASTATTYYAPSISIPKVEKKEKSIVCDTPKKSDEPVIFPVDPHAFNPNGLIKVPRTGTKNGALISWMDPLTKTEVFRWDENPNYPNGSHYHVIGTGHFIPGVDEVPEPFATIYFLFE